MKIDHNPIGNQHGKLEIIGPSFVVKTGVMPIAHVVAKCECGKIDVFRLNSIRSGNTKSCGCLCGDINRSRSGNKHPNYRHGCRNTRLYGVWHGMITRCRDYNSSSYSNYGGRGIRVSIEWHEFENFQGWAVSNGYSPELELDRIDNDRNYGENNCRWVTSQINNRNRRNNRIIQAFGETKCMVEWLEDRRCVVSRGVIRERLSKGWAAEQAITTPSREVKR